MPERNVPTSTGEPRVDPDRPIDPKAAELQAEKNPLRRFVKILGAEGRPDQGFR